MEEYYPSEIARLVLGYLKEVECSHSWRAFVQESFDLREYYRLYKEGRVYSTKVNGQSLLEVLREYCALKSKAISENNQSKDSNNNCHNYEVDKAFNKVGENAFTALTVDKMVQTSTSAMVCQTPKRKSKRQVSQLNFEDEIERDNLEPNAKFKNSASDLSIANDTAKTIADNENFGDIENQKVHQNISSANKPDALLNDIDGISELPNETFDPIQVNEISCPKNLGTENNPNKQEETSHNQEAAKSTNSEPQVNISAAVTRSALADEACDNLNSNLRVRKECSQHLNSTENGSGVYKECQSARSGIQNASDNVPAQEPCDDLASNSGAQKECKQDINSVQCEIDVHNQCQSDLDSAKSKIQNDTIVQADLVSINSNVELNIEVTKLNLRNKAQLDNVANPEISPLHNNTQSTLAQVDNTGNNVKSVNDQTLNLDTENNPNSQEVISCNQEAAKPTNSEPEVNISAAITGSAHKDDALDNVTTLAGEACNDLNSNFRVSKEYSQNLNSTGYESDVHKKCQSDSDSAISNIQNASDNIPAHESCDDLTRNSEAPRKCNKDINSVECETSVREQCQSGLDSTVSKIQNGTIVPADLVGVDSNVETNSEVTKVDSKNKAQLDNVANPEIKALHNNTQNTLVKCDNVKNNGKSLCDQTAGIVTTSLLPNKPNSGLAMSYPIFTTLQNVPQTTVIQKDGQCQIYMYVPVQTVPTVNLMNPVTNVVTNTGNRNVAEKENVTTALTRDGKHTGSFVTSAPEIDKTLSSQVQTPSKKKNSKHADTFITSSPKIDGNLSSEIQTPSKITRKHATSSTIPTLKQNRPVSPKIPIPVKKTGKRSLSPCKLSVAVSPEVDTPPKKIPKASKKRKTQQKGSAKQKKLNKKELVSSTKQIKQNCKRKPHSSFVSSPALLTEKTSLSKDLDCFQTSPKSPIHSNESATCKSLSKITDQNIEKNRVLKVLVSDVLKSSYIRCLDFNVDSVDNGRNKNHLEESCINERSQSIRHSGEESDKDSCESNRAGFNCVQTMVKNNPSVTLSSRSKRKVDSSKKINNFESPATNIITDVCNNAKETTKCAITVEKCQSDLSNTEELNSESLDSTDVLVKTIANALENHLENVPDKIEVVVLSDNEGGNNEENVNISVSVTTDQKYFHHCEDTEQQDLNSKCETEKDTENAKNITQSISNENEAFEVSSVGNSDSVKRKSSEKVMDVEQNDMTLQLGKTEENISSDKSVSEQDSLDHINIKKQMINMNTEVPATIYNEFSSEREDLDSSRSLMINTSPFSEDENANAVEILSINSDNDSLENGDSSVPANRSDCCNFNSSDNSNDICPPSNTNMSHVSLHNEEQKNVFSNINEKFSLQHSINDFSSEKQLVSPNSCHHAQNINLNSNVEDCVQDEKYRNFPSSNCLKKKTSPHLPQGIVDTVKYFDSQTKKKFTLKKGLNLNKSVTNTFVYKSKGTSKHKDSSVTDLTLNFVQTADASRCVLDENPEEILDLSMKRNSPAINNENSETSKMLIQHTNSSTATEKGQNNLEQNYETMLNDENEKTISSSDLNEKTRSFSLTGPLNAEMSVTVKDSNSLVPFKKRMRHRSNDSSFNHNCGEHLLLSQSMIKSKSIAGLENINKEELFKKIGTSRKYVSADSVEKSNETVKVYMSDTALECGSINSEAKTSLNIQQNTLDSNSLATHSIPLSSLKQNTDPLPKNSVNSASNTDKHAEVLLFNEDSQSTIKAQNDFRKLAAKKFLLEEDSGSDEDSDSPVKVHQTSTDGLSCKRSLLNEDIQTSVKVKTNTSNFSAKQQLPQKKPQSAIVASAIKNTCNSLEQNENRSKGGENVSKRHEYVHSNFEESGTTNDDCKQMCSEKSNRSPENRDLPLRISCKRKSSEMFLTNECSSVVGYSDGKEATTGEDHCLDNNGFYTDNSVLIKRQKLNKIPSSLDGISSPENNDNFSNTVEPEIPYLSSNERPADFSNTAEPEIPYLSSNECPADTTQGESLLLFKSNLVPYRLVNSIKTDVTSQDSPIRYASNTKKGIYKSALSKRIEKDPNIPAGVKIPSKWTTSNVVKYSHAIGHSVSNDVLNPKRIAGKNRRSRPTLTVVSIRSPVKGKSDDKKNFPQKSCTQNCLSQGPTSRNTVCNWVSKEKKKNLCYRATIKKSTKISNKRSAKLGNRKSLKHSINENKVPSASNASLKAHNQVCDEKVLAEIAYHMQLSSKVLNHSETTQDIVEADIGRSDENGSELAIAIAGVERELRNLSPNSSLEFPKSKTEYELSTEEKSSAISDNCEQEGAEDQDPLEFVTHNSRMIPNALQKMHVENIAQKSSIRESVIDVKTLQQSPKNISNAKTASHKPPLNYETEQKATEIENENLPGTVSDKMKMLMNKISFLGLDNVLDLLQKK